MPAESLGGLVAERHNPDPAAFAEHPHRLIGQVHVVDGQVGDLRPSAAGVEEQSDQCGVPSVGERPAATRQQQTAELVVGQHGHRLLGDVRGAHPVHRRPVDLLLAHQPAEELLQRTEGHRAGGRLSVLRQRRHEPG
jgi:hypothetical protein